MIRRGQVWRADLGMPRGASPGYERPVVVIQSDTFNKTNIDSVIVAAATTNLRLGVMPGNVRVASGIGGLREDSVVNITQLFTIDKEDLIEFWGQLPSDTITQIDAGLRLVLHLKEN
ncbi:MAG: type II toxin-antitoxin system PemK/MazF family toxin [Pyrinomonadaceae bacterium]|nr:type II toxin-antitoxin system PemK/MazF family toxin [Pyrinomonadaceae bacterium]